MKMRIKEQGIQDTANLIEGMAKESITARKAAVKDVGQAIKKQLSRNRQGGAGLEPLGVVSKLMGNRKPWGKKKFVVYVPKGRINPYAIVTTKGANKTMEEGGTVSISWAFRRFLHAKGVHLKGRRGTVTKMTVKGRPLFKITWNQMSSKIGLLYEERFTYQLSRAVRAKRYKKK